MGSYLYPDDTQAAPGEGFLDKPNIGGPFSESSYKYDHEGFSPYKVWDDKSKDFVEREKGYSAGPWRSKTEIDDMRGAQAALGFEIGDIAQRGRNEQRDLARQYDTQENAGEAALQRALMQRQRGYESAAASARGGAYNRFSAQRQADTMQAQDRAQTRNDMVALQMQSEREKAQTLAQLLAEQRAQDLESMQSWNNPQLALYQAEKNAELSRRQTEMMERQAAWENQKTLIGAGMMAGGAIVAGPTGAAGGYAASRAL